MKELVIAHIPPTPGQSAMVRVSYRSEPAGQPQVREKDFRFEVSIDDRQLLQWYLEEYLTYPWGEWRTRAQQAERRMHALGADLFEAVFSARDTAVLYRHVADTLHDTRIVIHADDPAGIALPWELMRDSVLGDSGDLAHQAYAFVRSQPDLLLEPPPPRTDEDTVNILLVTCRPKRPDGKEDQVAFQSVARPLLELFRPHRDRIHLDVLRPPTFTQLTRVLSDRPNFYHILHFDGHGDFPHAAPRAAYHPRAGDRGRLLFEDSSGYPHEVTGKDLGDLLTGKGVPIVVLNACRSGTTHPEATLPSVGNELLKAGARGVVAMAYSVLVHSAVRFVRRLYEGLINGEELARAHNLARAELRHNPQRPSPIGATDLRDWMVPVLFEAAPARLTEHPLTELYLDPAVAGNHQAKAGTEIGCPEPPDFGFIGRDDTILELERAFQNETIVLLKGMAGAGKTEAAMGFARWRAETGALNGPILFFNFEHYLPLAQVCDRVGQLFQRDVKEQLRVEWELLDAKQRRRLAIDILRRLPCLLIWDNFEPVRGFPAGSPSVWTDVEQEELRKFLSDLRGGQTKVLLTSRRDEVWLRAVYRTVEVIGLKLAEAQELAVRVLRRAGLDNARIGALSAYGKLLEYLDGNPLAIRVILPELKTRSPGDLLDTLKTGEVRLAAEDPSLGRDRSLAASLTYRLDCLDPIVRNRLGVLGLFQGFMEAQVLAAMGKLSDVPEPIRDLSQQDWVGILDAAAEVGLLERLGEGPNYFTHPALPWFFHRLLAEAFGDQRENLERCFCVTMGDIGRVLSEEFSWKAQAGRAIVQLSLEEHNLTFAIQLARRHQQWDALEGILQGLQRLLTTQGRWVEWDRLVTSLESEVTDSRGEPMSGRDGTWHALLAHRAQIAEYRRDFDTARAIYVRLKTYFEGTGNEAKRAAALHQLGTIAQVRRRFDEAERWYQESFDIKWRIRDNQALVITAHELGRVDQARGQLAEAQSRRRQTLHFAQRFGDKQGEAMAMNQMGLIAEDQAQLDDAERWYRQSLAISQELLDEHGQCNTLHQLGMIAEQRTQLGEAERWYRESLAISQRIGHEEAQASTLHQLGMIAKEHRQFDEAEGWYRQSLIIKQRIGDEYGQVSTLCRLGRIAEEQGNDTQALECYRQSRVLAARLDDSNGLAAALESISRVEGRGA